MTDPAERIVVALDVPAERIAPLVRSLPDVRTFKVGMEAFYREGAPLVRSLIDSGHDVFLDLKLHDIPNTVARAAAEVARLGVRYLTLHASGGRAMVAAAVDAVGSVDERTTCLGVTMLTSLSGDELPGVLDPGTTTTEKVTALAEVAVAGGCGGIVAAATEAADLRARLGGGVTLVCPGIRPSGASGDDQRRTATPARALEAGADLLVVGRAITAAEDPRAALAAILAEIQSP